MSDIGASVIVVGVDGSAASQSALAFAVREGACRESVIEVVTAWGWGGGPPGLPTLAAGDVAEVHAQEIQDAAVAGVLSRFHVSPVLSRRVVQGEAAEVLVRAASSADYLVVGTGRKGTLRRALLGSVSESCVRHASCPVVVVPESAALAVLETASLSSSRLLG